MELRNLFQENSRSNDLYLALGAIRGPDDESNKHLKIVTIVIRSYLGFESIYGDTMSNWRDHIKPGEYDLSKLTYRKFMGRLTKAIDEVESSDDHYRMHLRWAISNIGRDELIAFARDYGKRNGHYKKAPKRI